MLTKYTIPIQSLAMATCINVIEKIVFLLNYGEGHEFLEH